MHSATSINPAWQLRGSPARAFDAAVFFPCSEAGCSAVAERRWPVVVFGIGWASWALRYERTMRHLASHGFVVIAPSTDDHQAVPLAWQYAQTLLGALQFAAFEATRPGSLLEGRVDVSQSGAMGHSMGAGNALVAASLSGDKQWAASLGVDWPFGPASLLNFDAEPWPSIRAFVGLGVAPVVAPVAYLAGLRARTLMLTPELDGYVSPDAQRALFAALPPAALRQLAVIRGGSHCWLDEPRDGAGWGLPTSQCEQAERDAHFITPQAQVSHDKATQLASTPRRLTFLFPQLYITRKYIAAFFSAVLARDEEAAALVRTSALRADAIFASVAAGGASA